MGQGTGTNEEILKYETAVRQNPNDAEAHKNLGNAYVRRGMTDRAIYEFNRAIELKYKEGYEKGARSENVRVYGFYVMLSIVVGLLIAAIIVSILSWSDIDDTLKDVRRKMRVRAFIKKIGVKLASDIRKRAVEIAQSKEKLRDAIHRESDPGLRDIASSILPRLDDLTRQASLLLELQQNLSDYIRDINPSNLDAAQNECAEKLKRETDQETRRALEYQLKQIKNKRDNYSRAEAKIRTCEAVLSGIAARIDATSLDLMSMPSVLIKKQEFLEKVSVELDEEINLIRNSTEAVMREST